MLKDFSVLSFKELRNRSSEVVREKSRELHNKLCDKDQVYYESEMQTIKKKVDEHIQSQATKQSVKQLASQRVLERFQSDLSKSKELLEVSRSEDIDEFEVYTNRQINRHLTMEHSQQSLGANAGAVGTPVPGNSNHLNIVESTTNLPPLKIRPNSKESSTIDNFSNFMRPRAVNQGQNSTIAYHNLSKYSSQRQAPKLITLDLSKNPEVKLPKLCSNMK